jgi:methylmalonyl-CoA mutase cobalamin-binding subunit
MADLAYNQGFRRSAPSYEDRTSSALPGVITAEILPHLMRSHGIPVIPPPRSYSSTVSEADVEYICSMIAAGESIHLSPVVSTLHARGVSADDMMLDLLPAVARMFGQRWVSDETDFASVTIALGHLQQLRRDISSLPGQSFMPIDAPRRALLAPAPGEQHNFGIMIVDHFLHQAGWDVRTLPLANLDEIVNLVAQDSFEIAGLSVSCDAYLLQLEKAVATVRRASKNRDIGIIVGGRLMMERPEMARLVGADAVAIDGRDAVRQAEQLAARALRLQSTD